MAAPKSTIPFAFPFPQLIDSLMGREIRHIDRVLASELLEREVSRVRAFHANEQEEVSDVE